MLIAGVDEVGQGAMAGPLVVCATVFDVEVENGDPCQCGQCLLTLPVIITPCPVTGVKDSKKFSSRKKREEVAAAIDASPALVSKGFGVVPSSDINRKGMAWAWKAATYSALTRLSVRPDLVILDGTNRLEAWEGKQVSAAKADDRFWPVSAASVLAKVQRDRWMAELAKAYPAYAWEQNMGYGTSAHADGLTKCGVTPVHRAKWVNTWFRNLTLPKFTP